MSFYVESENAYWEKLIQFLAKFDSKMDLAKSFVKPYLVIQHDTQAKELYDLAIASSLKAELVLPK